MTDSDSDRQRDLGRTLLRSASLDVPRAGARARALERALAEEPTGPSRARRRLGALAGAFAVAATGALLLRGQVKPPMNQLQAEAPRAPSSASSAPVEVAAPLAPCPKLVVAQGGAPLIDDLEDRNARLSIADGRDGSWMVYNDGSGQQVPPGLSPLHPERLAKARGGSRYALHTSGGKFSIWGSILVGTFTDRGCYDVSAYSGIQFWAKGNTRIHVQLSVIDEISTETGGLCGGSGCYSGPRKAFDLGPQWHQFSLTWAELEQMNQPKKFRFDPKRVVSLNLSIHRQDTPFDLWIDDVRFSERQ